MIIGETVTLERYTKGPPDAMGDLVLIPTTVWLDSSNNIIQDSSGNIISDGDEIIENVLVQPGVTEDVALKRNSASNRPDGVAVVYTLHIPKGYEAYSFRGCRLKVRGEWMEVVGDPTYYAPENTPGAWNYPVEVRRCDG